MPLPVIPGCLRIAVQGQIAGGGSWANVWHAANTSGLDFDGPGIAAFHDIFSQFYVGPAIGAGLSVRQLCPTATTFDSIAYTPLDGSSGAFLIATSATGAELDAAMPAEVAEVLTIRTNLRGRQNRGRSYLPAFSKAHFDNAGHIASTTVDGVLAQIAGVEAALVSGGAHLGVASYGRSVNKAGVVHTWTPHFTQVQQFTMDNSADVIRGRKS